MRRLLAGGADPNKGREESGETHLHHVLAADPEVVTALLEAGTPAGKPIPGSFPSNLGEMFVSEEKRRSIAPRQCPQELP